MTGILRKYDVRKYLRKEDASLKNVPAYDLWDYV